MTHSKTYTEFQEGLLIYLKYILNTRDPGLILVLERADAELNRIFLFPFKHCFGFFSCCALRDLETGYDLATLSAGLPDGGIQKSSDL